MPETVCGSESICSGKHAHMLNPPRSVIPSVGISTCHDRVKLHVSCTTTTCKEAHIML